MNTKRTKWLCLLLPGCLVLQLSACLGTDPQFFLATSVANALVFNLISLAFDVIASGLTGTAALLTG
jgi:hypothetical protein